MARHGVFFNDGVWYFGFIHQEKHIEYVLCMYVLGAGVYVCVCVVCVSVLCMFLCEWVMYIYTYTQYIYQHICACGGVIAFSGSTPAVTRSDRRIPGLFWAHSHKDFKLRFCKDFTVKIS